MKSITKTSNTHKIFDREEKKNLPFLHHHRPETKQKPISNEFELHFVATWTAEMLNALVYFT